MPDGSRCSMCGGKKKIEDGGPPTIVGENEETQTPYIGTSGYRIVMNPRRPDRN
jgi:hypothetical protein